MAGTNANGIVVGKMCIRDSPYTVLVDKDGKVLGKNLRGPALEEKLAEVFK